MSDPGAVQVRQVPDAGALADAVVDWLSTRPADPFSTDVVVVPDAGAGRWLAQQAAARLGTDAGDGVCAGVEFTTVQPYLQRLVQEATRIDPREDPWQPRALTWTVLDVLDEAREEAWAAPVWAHLAGPTAAPGSRWAAAAQIARRFRRYSERAPELLTEWSAGRGDSWQAQVWRACHARLVDSPPDLVARTQSLTPQDWQRVAPERLLITQPGPLSRSTEHLLKALGQHTRLTALFLAPPPADDVLAQRLGARSRRAHEDWGRLAQVGPEDGLTGAATAPQAVEVHASHGPDRQVEVLRDVLTGLLEADHTLEPRDIVVFCPQLERFTPHLSAAFSPTAGPGHPGHGIRVRLSGRPGQSANPVLDFLASVLALPGARAAASELVPLVTHPAVAARFGWDDDDVDRIEELVSASGVRWGLDGDQRRAFGLTEQESNTWQAGLDTLVLGIALSGDAQPVVGDVVPFDDAESDTVRLIGDLVVVVDGLTAFFRAAEQAQSGDAWTAWARQLLDSLAGSHPDAPWQAADAQALLAELELAAAGHDTALTVAEFRQAVLREIHEREGYQAFGTGATLVCAPGELTGVPHRVVCLLGFDADAFPHPDPDDGDDLTAEPADPAGRRAAEREALLTAVRAATERVVVVYRAHDPVTNAAVPPSIPLAEVLHACRAHSTVTQHPLQPFAAANFDPTDGRSLSFDRRALAGAKALARPGLAAPDPVGSGFPSAAPPETITLAELEQFLRHPAQKFLRRRAGLFGGGADVTADELPLALDGLERWAIGDRLLSQVLAGGSLDAAVRAERHRGSLPVGVQGEADLTAIARTVGELALAAQELRRGDPVDHLIQCDVPYPARGERPAGSLRLTGSVRTFDGSLVDVGFNSIGPRHRLAAWARLLALGTVEPGDWRWIGVDKRGRFPLGSVPPTWNAPGLASLVELYLLGLDSPLPLPPGASEAYALAILQGYDAADRAVRLRVARAFDRELDADWRRFYATPDALLSSPAEPLDSRLYQEPSRFGTLARRVWEPLLRVQNGEGR